MRMIKFKYIPMYYLLVMFPHTVRAQAEEPLSRLDTLVRIAQEHNPAISAAQNRWQAATHRSPQTSSLDDPMFSYTRWARTPETRVGPQKNVFVLSQRFPYPGKLKLKGQMSDEDATAEQQRYDVAGRDVAFRVKQAYFELYWVDQSLQILDDYLIVLETFNRAAEEKYVTGAGIQANVLKSQVEMSTVLDRRLAFDRIRVGITSRLNALLGRAAGTPVEPVTIIEMTRYTSPESLVVDRALATRQELHIADAMIRKSDLMTRLAHLNYRPDFNVQASYITIPKVAGSQFTDTGKDAFGIMFNVNIPIRLKRRRAAVNEARALVESNQMTRENIRNKITAEISDFYFKMQHTGRTLDLYDQGLITQAEGSLESALFAYQNGNLDFLSLLDAERMILQVNLGYVREQSNYRKHHAELEWAAGGHLP